MNDTAIVVTTCDRPVSLERTIADLVKLGPPILIVNDRRGDSRGFGTLRPLPDHVTVISTPSNRGLACALNIGISYWLADKGIEWISYFQDDVEVDPDVLLALRDVQHLKDRPLLTGHDALEHKEKSRGLINGIDVVYKESCRATHMHAHRDYWASVLPIPTRELGAPKPVQGQPRGLGSNVDWWVASWAPSSVKMTHRYVTCVPGLVRTFLWQKKDSCWDNEQKAGEDQPLHRRALKDWRR